MQGLYVVEQDGPLHYPLPSSPCARSLRDTQMRFAVATMRSLAHRSRFAAAAAAAASFGTVVGGVTMLESARTPLPLARVVSYNVLSSHLCGADHYTMCKPEDLDPPTRRKRVEALLMEHMDKQAVICLQEVSVQWVGELTPFFERAGYTSSPHPHPNPKPHPNPYLNPNPNPNPNQVRGTRSSRATTATPSMATWVSASRGPPRASAARRWPSPRLGLGLGLGLG